VTTPAKKKWYIGGAIAAVLVVLAILYHDHVYFRSPIVFLPDAQHSVTADKGQQFWDDVASFTSIKEVSGGTAADAMSYEDAYRLYQGRLVQLNENCRSNPVTLLIPPKSVVMIGNDSQWQRSVIVGPRNYIIAPYDYVLATFNTIGNFAITCDSVQSVAIISVQ
jgi:hypothetical protein